MFLFVKKLEKYLGLTEQFHMLIHKLYNLLIKMCIIIQTFKAIPGFAMFNCKMRNKEIILKKI